MNDTVRTRIRQTTAALVALALVLSVFGPVGTALAQPSVSVTQSADATTVEAGDTVTLTTQFTVNELNAPQLQTDVPDGWSIQPQSVDGPAAYNDGTWTWLAGDEDGVNVSYTVVYEVTVPGDASPGDYTLSATGGALSPEDSSETSDSAATTITVAEPDQNEAPSASFTASPSSPEVGETVTFDASASSDSDGSIASYAWDFDGDGTADATGVQPATSFDSPGDYDVTLTVTDDDGETAQTTQTVSVSEPPAPAAFQVSTLTVESPVTEGDAATVTATVENTGDESGTQTVTVAVDGSQVDSESVTLASGAIQQVDFEVDTTGLAEGDHDVTVATDDDSATETLAVTAQQPANQDPSAAFTASPAAPEPGETVTFDASASSDSDGSIASYAWDFDGDGTVDATTTSPQTTHTYATAGDYDATLTVTDDDGATAETTQTVSVSAPTGDGPATSVSMAPSEDLIGVNSSATFDVVATDADGGVGAYSLTVSLNDSTAATITDVSVPGSPLTDVVISADGSTAVVDVALMDTAQTGPVTIANVTVDGEAEGTVTLDVSVDSLGTESGDAYDVTSTSGATLSVSELVVGGADQPAQDPDGDGTFEDVNGDGTVDELDVQLLFAERNSDVVQDSSAAFDFNGDGEFDVLDVQALYYEEVA